jgi:hypothetical protein
VTAGRGSTSTAGRAAVVALAALVTVVATACGVDLPFGADDDDRRYLTAGQELIEGELTDRIGLGPLEAACEGRGLGPGETFACTATSPGRPPIEFVATISDDGEGVDLASTNLLLAEQVEQVEDFAASLIAEETTLPIDGDDFECADASIVVGPGEVIDCLVTDPIDQTIHAVSVTVDDLDTLSVTVDVGDPVG